MGLQHFHKNLLHHSKIGGVYSSNDPKLCWLASTAMKVENTRGGKPAMNVTRGDIVLFITYLPEKDILGEVSFGGGYPFKPNQMVELQLDQQNMI